jgi:cephalosporin hydroxylase
VSAHSLSTSVALDAHSLSTNVAVANPVFGTPLDLWVMQEILWETKPDVLIECGSGMGGSALFCVSAWPGRVISIDTGEQGMTPMVEHPRIEFLVGSSLDSALVARVRKQVAGKKVMVFLDSDHAEAHVAAELSTWAPLVSEGCYLVVHDTFLGGHPVYDLSDDPGPMAAVQRFLKERSEFTADRHREKFYLTFSPYGWLRREKSEPAPPKRRKK